MNEPTRDIPGVIAPPPFIFLFGLGIGLLVSFFFPLPFLSGTLLLVIGLPLIAVGIILLGWALTRMAHAHTSPDIGEPTRALVVDGPYQFTRNPIYLSFTLIYAGIALAFNSLWALLLLPFVLALIDRGVIAREEKYLERKFGDQYLQ